MDVKTGGAAKLDSDAGFTLRGIVGAFQSCCYRYYQKYVTVKEGGISGVSKVWAAHMFNCCLSHKELKCE